MLTLRVYVSEECWSSAEARHIAADIGSQFPEVFVELVDIKDGAIEPSVIAVPTYLLDGQSIFLGNPSPQELGLKLATALRKHHG